MVAQAAVVELVDTPDSKSCERKLVTVQVRPAAPDQMVQSKDWTIFYGPGLSAGRVPNHVPPRQLHFTAYHLIYS